MNAQEEKTGRTRRRNHEGTFRQLPSGRFEGAKWVAELRRSISVTGDTEAKARKALNEKVELIRSRQLPARTATVTFYDYARKIVGERDVSERTRDKYSFELERYTKPLHRVRLGDLQPPALRALYAGLRRQGLSSSVQLHVHSLVHLVLETARTDRLIAFNPAAEKGIRPRPARGSRTAQSGKAMTRSEAGQLLRHAPHVLHGEIVAFLLLTGMRRGEALALCWNRVDLTTGVVQIRRTLSLSGSRVYEGPCKTEQSLRDVPLSPEGVELLRYAQGVNRERHAALYPDSPASPYVFPTVSGTAHRPDNIRRILHQIYDHIDAEAAQLEGAQTQAEGREAQHPPRVRRLPLHALRHTFVSIMLARGHTVEQVAYWIGDDPTTVLKVYSHLYVEDRAMPSMGMGQFNAAEDWRAGRADDGDLGSEHRTPLNSG